MLRLAQHHANTYSIHSGAGIDNLNNAAFRSFLAKVFEASGNMNITTRSISGHKNFTAWEYDVTFNYDKPLDEVNRKAVLGLEVADGRLAHMVSVSLFWWNDDGKIVKAHNYSMAVAN